MTEKKMGQRKEEKETQEELEKRGRRIRREEEEEEMEMDEYHRRALFRAGSGYLRTAGRTKRDVK